LYAELFFENRIGRESGGGQDRSKPDPWAVLRGEQHIVEPEVPEAGAVRCMPVREEGDRLLFENAN
jgi:hypothetical protein